MAGYRTTSIAPRRPIVMNQTMIIGPKYSIPRRARLVGNATVPEAEKNVGVDA